MIAQLTLLFYFTLVSPNPDGARIYIGPFLTAADCQAVRDAVTARMIAFQGAGVSICAQMDPNAKR